MNGLPDVPNPSALADSVAESGKLVVEGGIRTVSTLGDGAKRVLFDTIRDVNQAANGVISNATSSLDKNVNTLKSTVDSGARNLSQVAGGVRNQVNRGAGEEVIGKLKRGVEGVLR